MVELHRERTALAEMLTKRPDLRKTKAISKVKPKRKKTVSRRKTRNGQGGKTLNEILGVDEGME